MFSLRTITNSLRALLGRDAANRDLGDEVNHYVEMSAADKMRDGMPRDEALRAARAELGGIESVKERVRSGGWESVFELAWRDAVLAVRALRREPGFTAIAFITLALGIGANTAMFSVVNAVVLRPLPYRAPNSLVMVWTDDARRGLHRELTAHSTILDWRNQSRSLTDIAYFSTQRAAALGNDPSAAHERTRSAFVSGNLFATLGASPVRGRAITADDEANGANVVVISYAFSQKHFGGIDGVIGKRVTLEDDSHGGGTLTVVGVMPAGFYFPDKLTDLWTPATTYWRFERERTERFPSWARRWNAVARLAPARSVRDARAELAGIGSGLAAQYPTTEPDFPGFTTTVLPVLDFVTGTGLQSALWILFGAVALVLLVACANVASLMLARGVSRHREFVVRHAQGAGRARLAGQLVLESVTLSVVGAAGGLLLATWGTRLFALVAARYVPRADEIGVDAHVLAFTAVTAIVAGVVCGIVPALKLPEVVKGLLAVAARA